MRGFLILLALLVALSTAVGATNSPTEMTSSIASEEIVEFDKQPALVQQLLSFCLNLAQQHLAYTPASADPANGGMDCSGFIYFVLQHAGFKEVPRDASGQYVWTRHANSFHAVISHRPDSFEMKDLLPGDLLFWTGTYNTDHDPPISHVMIYLGTEKSTGNKIMIGSSDGRTYHGEKRSGISVFDFLMPHASPGRELRATFVGYARIPGLRS